jgi:hypothetical protein
VARDRRRARDTRTSGPRTARIAAIVNQTVSEGKEGTGESFGQLGGASLSNCRELRAEGSQREAWLQPLRKDRFLSKRNCLAENQIQRLLDASQLRVSARLREGGGVSQRSGPGCFALSCPNRPNFTEEPFFEYALPEFGSRAPVAQIRAYSRHASAQCAGYQQRAVSKLGRKPKSSPRGLL